MGFDFGKTLKPGDMVALRREMNPLYEEHDYGIVLELRDISLIDQEEDWPASKLRLVKRAIGNSGDWEDKYYL